jgi:hypothetical protein
MFASTLFQRDDRMRLDMVVTSASVDRAVVAAKDRHKPGHVVRGGPSIASLHLNIVMPKGGDGKAIADAVAGAAAWTGAKIALMAPAAKSSPG